MDIYPPPTSSTITIVYFKSSPPPFLSFAIWSKEVSPLWFSDLLVPTAIYFSYVV